jgi:hypothetical protein
MPLGAEREKGKEKGKTSIGAARDVGTAPIRENKFEGYEWLLHSGGRKAS